MIKTMEPWLLPQLRRMAITHPERLDAVLQEVIDNHPELFEELAIIALDSGDLTPGQAAEVLATDPQKVEELLKQYRQKAAESVGVLIGKDIQGVARVPGKHVTVWEIVRAYRKMGSVAALRAMLPGLSEDEVRAALAYAGENPDEIGAQIREYEALVERTRAAYPFK